MKLGRTLRAITIGLGLIAGAVLPGRAQGQVPVKRDTVASRKDTLPTRVDSAGILRQRPPQAPDTIRVPTPPTADTMLKNDSAARGVVPLPVAKTDADTLRSPLTRAEAPPILEIGPERVYDRTALFATGSLTLGDLLSRVPGVTEFTSGWLGAPTVAASQGDLRRIRIFLDGLELDPMTRRAQGVAPVNDLPLHSLEELRIERGADEIRVHARTWRVDKTIPYTRADIATGDQSTNLYRAFFGRRYAHGEALQVAAEQYNTQPNRALASSDGLHLMGRFALVKGPWTADAFAERGDKDRAKWTGVDQVIKQDTIAGMTSRRTTAYLRLGNGDPERGRWLQLLVGVESERDSPRSSTVFGSNTLPSAGDSGIVNRDTSTYSNQYLVTGGVTRGPARVSVAERVRVGGGRTSSALSGRAAFSSALLSASLLAETQSALDPARLEALVRLSPHDRIAITGAVSRTSAGIFDRVFPTTPTLPTLDSAGAVSSRPSNVLFFKPYDSVHVARYYSPARTSARAEVGVRLRDLWVSAGMMRRGAAVLLPAAEFDSLYALRAAIRTEGEATAKTASVRGRLYRAINVDAWAVAWNDTSGFYRPKYQTRTELYMQSALLDRFPRGNFGLLASLAHEYRSSVRFPVTADSVRTANGFRTLDFKLEIRIQTAVISYQFRNLLQERYAQIPGFNMPHQTQFYGIRWDFWN